MTFLTNVSKTPVPFINNIHHVFRCTAIGMWLTQEYGPLTASTGKKQERTNGLNAPARRLLNEANVYIQGWGSQKVKFCFKVL